MCVFKYHAFIFLIRPPRWQRETVTVERPCFLNVAVSLKGWDCLPSFLLVWIHLGLNVNRFWFLNFNNVPSILDNYLEFWCISGQTFSEIRRISEKDWQLSPRFSEKVNFYYKLLGDMLMLLMNILGEPWTQLPILLRELWTQLSILLKNSMNLREGFTTKQHFLITANQNP